MKKMVAACAFIFTAVTFALAHSGATGIVKERMDAMKEVAASTRAIMKADWSDVEGARSTTVTHAAVLKKHAADMKRLFPEGSIKGPSEATPSIWQKPKEFEAIALALEKAADGMMRDAPGFTRQAQMFDYFDAVAKTCRSCHAGFRKKK